MCSGKVKGEGGGGGGTIPKSTQATILPPLPPCIPRLTIFRGTVLYTLSQADKEGPEGCVWWKGIVGGASSIGKHAIRIARAGGGQSRR